MQTVANHNIITNGLNFTSMSDIALADIITAAREKLPHKQLSRFEKAIVLIRGGNILQEDDDTFTVKSECSDKVYTVVGNACDCPDAKRITEGELDSSIQYCKHVLASFAYRRMAEKVAQQIEADTGNVAQSNGHGEAPYSWTLKTADSGQFTVRATSEDELLSKVESLRAKLNVTVTPQVETNGHADVKHCAIHDALMTQRIGKKGKPYHSHIVDGKHCFGRA